MTFTSDQVVGVFCFVLTLMQIANLYITLKGKAENPMNELKTIIKDLQSTIDDLTKRVSTLEGDRADDNASLNKVKKTMLDSTRILMEAVQALIIHELDGNNTEGLKKAKEAMSKFVFDQFGGGND